MLLCDEPGCKFLVELNRIVACCLAACVLRGCVPKSRISLSEFSCLLISRFNRNCRIPV
jgi:hypothetical protein